ncbi:hypothetical protein A2701_02610 [Candidatus Amesbacteria bacterium RIFCSPHIGHO2_01_FULL_47_34]|nr:MAG: hypothetical protein A2701_02610 [Candidatus Amesbacteria bacterium RIFCSPHIGHO2_01_FULL_47_34]
MAQDLPSILQWWVTWVVLGAAGWPITRMIFAKWENRGYLLTKITGTAAVSYLVWWIGSLKVIPFSWMTIFGSALFIGLAGWRLSPDRKSIKNWFDMRMLWEEGMFLILLIFWSWIKAHEPHINGLEKFMDYGFTRSILQGSYFPASDMWFSGGSINYYYFGHLMMAVVTKLSGLNLATGFNLMLCALFSLTFSVSFAIGRQLLGKLSKGLKTGGALLTAFLVTLSGNMQTIYVFTKGYWSDIPPAFWTIWSDFSSFEKIREGWMAYWYPNATRFIPYTIHEFPAYSFVVSDIHGHVLSIPLVLFALALLINMYLHRDKEEQRWWEYALYGMVAGMAFMTNALDGPIYLGLLALLVILNNVQYSMSNFQSIFDFKKIIKSINFQKIIISLGIALGVFVVTILPFVISFKPFVSGVAVNCPPASMANSKIGPLVFEGVEKCQKSPLWMMAVLWGFFTYCAAALWIYKIKSSESQTRKLLLAWAIFCLALIIFPEFFYFADIYPQHFRSNTMFKLGYQVFIMMSILSGYTITQIWGNRERKQAWLRRGFLLLLAPMLFFVSIYPNFAVKSYFEGLKTYRGIYGLTWMKERYPDYFGAVMWIEENIREGSQPVILEANGDSYTDYNMVSAFSGLPSVAGWVVHEWLWRGSYEPIAKRGEEVRQVYEAANEYEARTVLNKYDVKFVVLGSQEREKYLQLNEEVIKQVATPVFTSETVTIYKVN